MRQPVRHVDGCGACVIAQPRSRGAGRRDTGDRTSSGVAQRSVPAGAAPFDFRPPPPRSLRSSPHLAASPTHGPQGCHSRGAAVKAYARLHGSAGSHRRRPKGQSIGHSRTSRRRCPIDFTLHFRCLRASRTRHHRFLRRRCSGLCPDPRGKERGLSALSLFLDLLSLPTRGRCAPLDPRWCPLGRVGDGTWRRQPPPRMTGCAARPTPPATSRARLRAGP